MSSDAHTFVGICTISLDFADVDWNQGNYFIKAFVNGEAIGASQIKSVPFALIADGVRGVLTKRQLIGTWKASSEEKGSLIYHTFNLEKDGSFSYRGHKTKRIFKREPENDGRT